MMQTFLPYDDFGKSVKCLDHKRLGKQRVEAKQILEILLGITPYSIWINHPAVLMWTNHTDALALYMNYCINEWINRGYINTIPLFSKWTENIISMPIWFGMPEFHASHRSNLLRKDWTYYSRYGWTEPTNLPYMWPAHDNLYSDIGL